MCPPYGSRFFHFDMQNFQNVAASGVHGPPYEVHAPLREILDPPLVYTMVSFYQDQCRVNVRLNMSVIELIVLATNIVVVGAPLQFQ